MRERLLSLQARLVLHQPGLVVVFALVLGVIAFPAVTRLAVHTSRIELVPADDDTVVAFHRFGSIFGTVHSIFLVVDGPPAAARRFVDAAATALRHTEAVRAVAGKLDLDWVQGPALRAKPPAELSVLSEEMNRLYPVLNQLFKNPTPTTFLSTMADEINDPDSSPPTLGAARAALQTIDDFTGAALHAVDPTRPTTATVLPALDLAAADRSRRGMDKDGYLVSKDGSRLVMLISPRHPPGDAASSGVLLATLRSAIAPALAAAPDVHVSFGGSPVQDVTEDSTVKRDIAITSVFATVVVVLLSILAFRNALLGILANLVMGFSIYLTMAAAYLLVGHLNVISSVFAAVLVGVGIDFGIYLFQLYLDALPVHGPDAMRHALTTGTPGIVTGAITPAAAFYSLMLHRLPAFHDLGVIAGTGMLLALAAMLVLFPALVVLMEKHFRKLSQLPPSWIGQTLAGSLHRGRRAIPLLTVLILLVLLQVPSAPFDYDISNLQAAAAESSRTEALLRDFGLSSNVVMFQSPDLAGAAQLARKLRQLPAVGMIDGPTALVSANPTEGSTAVHLILSLGRNLPDAPARPSTPFSPAAFAAAIDEAQAALPKFNRLANLGESQALLDHIAATGRDIATLKKICTGVKPAQVQRALATLSDQIYNELVRFRRSLRDADRPPLVRIDQLPPELSTRYLGKDQSLATYAWPAHDLSEKARADAFYAAVLSVGVPAAGTPVIACRMLDLIQEGFTRAAVLALFIIVTLVYMDLRSVKLTTLGLLPMVCGAVAAVACLRLSGRSWNPVNSMALPVMFGEGVGFGVNLVHRWWTEGAVAPAVAGTGRAVVYAASTSITGFGSLMLAEHRGLQAFGGLLFLGTFVELLVAVFVLPRLLTWLPQPPPAEHPPRH